MIQILLYLHGLVKYSKLDAWHHIRLFLQYGNIWNKKIQQLSNLIEHNDTKWPWWGDKNWPNKYKDIGRRVLNPTHAEMSSLFFEGEISFVSKTNNSKIHIITKYNIKLPIRFI